jgi:hypothetical protein
MGMLFHREEVCLEHKFSKANDNGRFISLLAHHLKLLASAQTAAMERRR